MLILTLIILLLLYKVLLAKTKIILQVTTRKQHKEIEV